MSKKPVIVFEGIEGSGKTFHIESVAKYLKKKKISFIKVREPGGSINSEKIRRLILSHNSNFNKLTDLLLYFAARNENIEKLKKNHKKKVILIDRFKDSTIAYQHYGFGIDIKFINLINDFILKNFKVDYTFLNIVNKNNMYERLKNRKSKNRYDSFDGNFYQKIQKGFLKLAKKNKKKYKIIDSNLDINHNKKLIIQIIDRLL